MVEHSNISPGHDPNALEIAISAIDAEGRSHPLDVEALPGGTADTASVPFEKIHAEARKVGAVTLRLDLFKNPTLNQQPDPSKI